MPLIMGGIFVDYDFPGLKINDSQINISLHR